MWTLPIVTIGTTPKGTELVGRPEFGKKVERVYSKETAKYQERLAAGTPNFPVPNLRDVHIPDVAGDFCLDFAVTILSSRRVAVALEEVFSQFCNRG